MVAFTDHDMLPDDQTLKQLKAYAGPVKWLVGCEISSGLPKELGGGPAEMFHIVGLFTDPTNQALLEHCKSAVSARTERMERMVKNLNGIGIKLTVDDCLSESGGESVGRPHIARALVKYPENLKTMAKMESDMKLAAESDPKIKEQYDQMMARVAKEGIDKEPFGLFLTNDSFIQGVYVDYLYNVDMDGAVKQIREAGGVAIIAHWATIRNKIDQPMLEGFLKSKRLDGIELASKFRMNSDEEVEAEYKMRQMIADTTSCLQTMGVDSHKPEHFAEFAKLAIATKSDGITAELVEKIKPDLTWSNLN